MNIWKVIGSIDKDLRAAKDLIEQVAKLHADPRFAALIASDPQVKAAAEAISRDVRTIQESFK